MNPFGIAAHLCEKANTDGTFISVTSQAQLYELRTVLKRDFMRGRSDSDRRNRFYVDYARRCEIVADPFFSWPRVRDPDDDYIVEIADAASACIVSGDSDLFAARMPEGIEVHSVGWFSRNLLHLDVDALFPYPAATTSRSGSSGFAIA